MCPLGRSMYPNGYLHWTRSVKVSSVTSTFSIDFKLVVLKASTEATFCSIDIILNSNAELLTV